MSGLSPNDIVNVQVSISPNGPTAANFGTLLIAGSTPSTISLTERIRLYTSLTGVGADFATTSPEYLTAEDFFAQSPQPAQCYVGFWNQLGKATVVTGGVLSAAQQTLSNFTQITAGTLTLDVDSIGAVTSQPINLSAATDLSDVAYLIQQSFTEPVLASWNGKSFLFTTPTPTGGAQLATGSLPATDISTTLALTTALGATTSNNVPQETMEAAVQIFMGMSTAWYCLELVAPNQVDADRVAVGKMIEPSNNRIFAVTTGEAGVLSSTSTTDIAALLQAANLSRTMVQYSSTDVHAAASLFGRIATVDFTATNSTITLKFKTEPGIVAETLSESQAATLATKNCNVFTNYSDGIAILQQGTMANGEWIDDRVNSDWLANAIQVAVINLLLDQPKIGQTDAGCSLIETTVDTVCAQAVNNGFLAPGVWTGPAFGALSTGQTLAVGYYVYIAPISTLSVAGRKARKCPPIQVAGYRAGAVHAANVLVNLV